MFVLSPIFRVSDIEITGNERLSNEYILEASGLDKPVNIFLYSPHKAQNELLKNLLLESASISKLYPDKLQISVQERHPIGYAKHQGAYLCLDEDGMVLSVSQAPDKPLPVISGLEFDSYALGEPISAGKSETFETMVFLANLLEKHSLLESEGVSRVDVGDTSDIHLYIYNIDVAIGRIDNADEKIRTMKAIVKGELPDAQNVKGTLDVRVIGSQYYFKVLT
jgi:cell division protein FtsQ